MELWQCLALPVLELGVDVWKDICAISILPDVNKLLCDVIARGFGLLPLGGM
jgi:hypothetical protein